LARRWLLVALGAAAVIVSWARLETRSIAWEDWLPMVLLALLPIGAVALRRSWLVVALALAGSTLVASSLSSDVALADARLGDPSRDFFGPALEEGMIRAARDKERLSVDVIPLRDFTDDTHRTDVAIEGRGGAHRRAAAAAAGGG